MTRKEVLTAIEQNSGKDLFMMSEELIRDDKTLVRIERVSKTVLLHNAKNIYSIRYSTYGKEKLDDGWGGQWYDEIIIFSPRKKG